MSKHLSTTLAQKSCAQYLASLARMPAHPLHREVSLMRSNDFDALVDFFLDFAELIALASTTPPTGNRLHPAAAKVRASLALHPSWMRCASDLASQAMLDEESFSTLASWID